MHNQPLYDRAREIEAWIEEHMVDPNGVVYTFVDRTTGKLLTNDVIEPADYIRLKKGTTAGWYAYENCTMVTASYMAGLLWRYEVDGDIQALARARRCFHALCHIYDTGKQREEGFMPKIYDNQYSDETSSDQILFAMVALDHFHRHATAAEKPVISRMIAEMVRFFAKRDYKLTYCNIKDMQWPLARFTMKTLMAYRHSGDEFFRKEYERLLALGVNEYPGEEQIRPKLAGRFQPSALEKEEGGWLLTYVTASAQMDLTELDYLLGADPQNAWAIKWKRSAMQMWNEGTRMMTDTGRAYTTLVMDFDTHELRPITQPRFLKPDASRAKLENFGEPDLEAFGFYPYMLYMHSCRSAYTASLFARAGIQVARHFPNDVAIRPLARQILKSLRLHDMTYLDDPDQLAPQFRYRCNIISGDTVTHWLWGYWQGRSQQVFTADE